MSDNCAQQPSEQDVEYQIATNVADTSGQTDNHEPNAPAINWHQPAARSRVGASPLSAQMRLPALAATSITTFLGAGSHCLSKERLHVDPALQLPA
jgi:hypothetical protein